MTNRSRKTFTEEERQRCWQLRRQGLGYSDIAREIASKPGTVFGLISAYSYPKEPLIIIQKGPSSFDPLVQALGRHPYLSLTLPH